ncbi:MAG: hypothetical protein QOF77_2212 [Solirubrobacteraceae bacterium]|nr:hypothetical protein [Solirubrobacteraceae bacterium]
MLPVGACLAALELTLLGFAFVPFDVSLAVVIAAGLATAVLAVRRRRHPLLPRPLGATVWPLYVAALLAAFILVPLYHAGYPTVIGDGSDAHLAAGTAQFLEGHHPLAQSAAEPVNKVPLVWRSKTPIYYALAAVARLSGEPTWTALSPMMAVVLALSLLGFFLAARELLASNLLGALAAMGLVGLDRMVIHTAVHPYYNQLWGFMTMAPALVLAWRVVDDRGRVRSRGTVGLLLLFLAIGAFAYPLAMPIPVVGLAVFLWRARRERAGGAEPMPPLLSTLRRQAAGRSRKLRWLIVLLLAVPVLGVAEKLFTGFAVVVDPTRSLFPWAGDVDAYFPTHQFLSLESADLLPIAAPLLALGILLALRRAPRPVAFGMFAVLLLGVLGSVWFHARDNGQYFDFKLLAYLGPLAVATAAVGASRLPVVGWAALALFGLTAFHGADTELARTGNQLSPDVQAVSQVTRIIGPGQSVRLDMNPPLQIWVAYFLHDEPLCSQRPLFGTSYPHVAVSRRARYILADHFTFPPLDAAGPPIATVGQFQLYRERPDVPGRDRCSRTRVQTVLGVG